VGIRTIILPADNEKDLADIPKEIQDDLTIRLVENMDDVLRIALTEQPSPLDDSEQINPAALDKGDGGELPSVAH
jgi:ATP-dependent Lon protease